MKITDIINEAIQVHSESLLAWVITAAETYTEKPVLIPEDVFHWQAMIYSNQRLLAKALSKVRIIPVEGDPYAIVGQQGGGAENAVIKDIVYNKQLKVFSGGNPHPVMTNKDNIMFRAIHDFFAHAGPQAKSLKAFYDRQQLVTPQDAVQLPPFVLSSNSFTIRGEMNAYLTHTKLSPPDAWPALFTEIIGQASYYFVAGDFPVQKVAVLDGFDFRQLGVCTGQRQQRMQELLAIIHDPNQPAIQTHVNNVVLDKNKINWKLLSSGTASRQIESLTETGAGMQRILQHMQGSPFIIMSGWRYESPSGDRYTRDQKNDRNAQLKQRLFSDYGLASINQKGVWPEERNDQGHATATGQEDSLFIPMNQSTSQIRDTAEFKDIAIQMMINYDQDAVVFNDGRSTMMLYHPDRPDDQFGLVKPLGTGVRIFGQHRQIPPEEQGWSQKRNYKYVFGGDDNGIPDKSGGPTPL